jgi:hypothetical protein
MPTKRGKMLPLTPTNGGVESDVARTSDCRRMKNCGSSESMLNKFVKTSANWPFLRVIWLLFCVFGVLFSAQNRESERCGRGSRYPWSENPDQGHPALLVGSGPPADQKNVSWGSSFPISQIRDVGHPNFICGWPELRQPLASAWKGRRCRFLWRWRL